jgi:hypothetical protein
VTRKKKASIFTQNFQGRTEKMASLIMHIFQRYAKICFPVKPKFPRKSENGAPLCRHNFQGRTRNCAFLYTHNLQGRGQNQVPFPRSISRVARKKRLPCARTIIGSQGKPASLCMQNCQGRTQNFESLNTHIFPGRKQKTGFLCRHNF